MPLIKAAVKRDLIAMGVLLCWGADVNAKYRGTVALDCCKTVAMGDMLLHAGADPLSQRAGQLSLRLDAHFAQWPPGIRPPDAR